MWRRSDWKNIKMVPHISSSCLLTTKRPNDEINSACFINASLVKVSHYYFDYILHLFFKRSASRNVFFFQCNELMHNSIRSPGLFLPFYLLSDTFSLTIYSSLKSQEENFLEMEFQIIFAGKTSTRVPSCKTISIRHKPRYLGQIYRML